MNYSLENDQLKIEVDSFGAELKSVVSKITNVSYLWNGDPAFWGRTSPVLFPFVGSLKDKTFTCKGKNYPMGQHGFARDMEHTLLSQSSDTLWFVLKSSEETMAKYPYEFILRIGYILQGNTLRVLWEVENPSEETLPFSIGAHPAFLCPNPAGEHKEGYKIFFGKYETPKPYFREEQGTINQPSDRFLPVSSIHHHGNTLDTGLAVSEDLVLPLKEGYTPITPEFFDRCTYMIEGNQANVVSLVNPAGNAYITVYFNTPLFAIWSPEKKNAPFVCIEPWFGRCDHIDFHGELSEREYTNLLENGKIFCTDYVMQFQ
ncbi:MAG: aldose 1-epimerase family protein [Lachnospiraceae bacterium]